MIATTHAMKLSGIDGTAIAIETEITKGIGIHLVGLADAAVKESLLRTVTAIQANGYRIPGQKVVINLAPADLYKSGSGYDLPIALTLIAASGQDEGMLSNLPDWLVMGELGLDGSVRHVPGAVQAVETAMAEHLAGVIIPAADKAEVPGLFERETTVPVYAAGSLREAIAILAAPGKHPTVWDLTDADPDGPSEKPECVWDTLAGRDAERRAIEVAAAGGHHILLAGPTGSGKATLAKALREILPPVTLDEALAIAKAHSAAGKGTALALSGRGNQTRPFRSPHHSASKAALLGGGCGENILPGEVTLAHGGVLHIDEIAEAPKSTLEALRAPLEDKQVTICRLKSYVKMPAAFQLAVSTALCPCGRYGDGDSCHCTPGQRSNYLSKLGNPLFDHIDVHLFVRKQETEDPTPVLPEGESRESVAFRVQKARETQRLRFGDGRLNADMKAKDIEKHCVLGEEEKAVIERVTDALGLSYRSYTRILKVARTIADLAGEKDIRKEHLLEAAGYRFLDRRELIPCADGFDAAKDISETTAKRS